MTTKFKLDSIEDVDDFMDSVLWIKAGCGCCADDDSTQSKNSKAARTVLKEFIQKLEQKP